MLRTRQLLTNHVSAGILTDLTFMETMPVGIGDIPIDEQNRSGAGDLSTVFKEVALTNGTGTVPFISIFERSSWT